MPFLLPFVIIDMVVTMLKDIKGVGPKVLGLLNKLGIYNEEDLIDYFPFKYNILEPTDLKEGPVVISGMIETTPITTYIKKSLNKLSFRIEAFDQLINVTIFNRAFMKNSLRRGLVITVIGEYDGRKNTITASNIMLKKIENSYIEPVYHVTSGISSKLINNLVDNCLKMNPSIVDYIPPYLKEEYDFPDKEESVVLIHKPTDLKSIERAIERSKYEELFRFMFKINYLKSNRTEKDGLLRTVEEDVVLEFIKSLPFDLTEDQLSSIKDIVHDLRLPKRMNRLLLGDVGSGKTIVAVASVFYNARSGYQSALLVPTEILATQHYFNIIKLFKAFNIRVELLKGKMIKSERCRILDDLKNGEIDLLIGTHAVLEEDVVFKNLGLVITDEQHRFGVNQRSTFQNKGTLCDVLYMSATPIPRTYALTIYGDMDISIIKTKPAGRKEIETLQKTNREIKEVLNMMLEEIKAGHVIYAICPLIEPSDEMNLMDAVTLRDKLDKAFHGKIPIGLLHGRMKPNEKEETMEEFKNGITRILVSTTVVEVGVDVSNATMMVIWNAERFGLASIHQLRGRIGRSSLDSRCILLSDSKAERLGVLVESSDGFYISEQDFKMRGEGDLFGVRQSGDMVFKIANLQTDMALLTKANVDSAKFIDTYKMDDFEEYPEYQNIIESLRHLD